MSTSDDEHPPSASEREPLRVLLIEDDDHLAEALTLLLRNEGYTVTRCWGGQAALLALRESTLPDLVVLDLVMPDMNGWQFRVAQRREPLWANIPLIAISADQSAKAEAIDALAYFGKPLDIEAFLATIRGVERDLRAHRGVARASEFDRLASLGSLVGGIAHEINNPLTFVMGSLELLQRDLLALANPAGAAQPFSVASSLRTLERARIGTERIADVIRCVSLFAFAEASTTQVLDVHEVLESSLQVVSNELRHAASLERAYRDVPHVRGNAARLGQVFLNLLLNALAAIREADQRGALIRVQTEAVGDRVLVTISDNTKLGAGSLRAHMFDPLASMATGRTGMPFGLAISREVIEAMGGSIEVKRAEPEGTSFCIALPACGAVAYPVPTHLPATRSSTRRYSVVVVDDEPLVCELFEAMLEHRYDVAAFSSPRAALASLLEGRFDIVLCDVMMPELDGLELYERLREQRADLAERFIFITGGAFTERARAALKQTNRPTLRKPCAQRELLELVEATLLDAERAS